MKRYYMTTEQTWKKYIAVEGVEQCPPNHKLVRMESTQHA